MTYTDYLLAHIKKPNISLLIVIIVVLLSYANVFPNQFVWDDRDTIQNWQATRSWSSVPAMLAGAVPPGHPGNYRPVRNILYVVAYHMWGTNPWGYHVQTILLAVAIAVIVYGITAQLVPNTWVPLLTALFFGTHPMHVEALTWMTSMMDMHGMLFGFGAVYCYLAWRKQKGWTRYVYTFLLAFLAIFSNEITLAVPILLTWVSYIFPTKQKKYVWVQLAPFFTIIAINFYIRAVILHIGARFVYTANSIGKTALIMFRAVWEYIATLLVPNHLTINHSLGTGITSWGMELFEEGSSGQKAVQALTIGDPVILLSLCIIIGVVITAYIFRRRHPLYTFAIGWMFIAIVPVSNIIPTEAMMTERYAFLASYGYCLLLALVAHRLTNLSSFTQTRSKIVWACIVLIISGYTIMTIHRNSQWHDNFTLWTVTTKETPEAILPHLYLAETNITMGNVENALQEYLIARDLSPKQADIDIFIASMYHTLGKDKESMIYLTQAIKKNPWNVEPYFRLGNIFKKEQQWESAVAAYTTGLKLDPNHLLILNNLGVVYSIQGNKQDAIAMYTKALTVDPSYENARINLQKIQNGDTGTPIEEASPQLQPSDLVGQ